MTNKNDDGRDASEKMGTNDDPLSIDSLLQQGKEMEEKLHKVGTQGEIYGYPIQEMRNGRPYFYLIWHEITPDGRRIRPKRYIGTALPLGYSLGKPVKLASGENRG